MNICYLSKRPPPCTSITENSHPLSFLLQYCFILISLNHQLKIIKQQNIVQFVRELSSNNNDSTIKTENILLILSHIYVWIMRIQYILIIWIEQALKLKNLTKNIYLRSTAMLIIYFSSGLYSILISA